MPNQETWDVPGNVMVHGAELAKSFAQATYYPAVAPVEAGAPAPASPLPNFVTKVVIDDVLITASLAFNPNKPMGDIVRELGIGTANPLVPPSLVSKLLVNRLAKSTRPRPRQYSLWPGKPDLPGGPGKPSVPQSFPGDPGYVSDYTSWPSLTRRDYSGRHMKPAAKSYMDSLPPKIDDVVALFQRPANAMKTDRSSVLFMFFAQWFTDSFLRFKWGDRRQNTSNHEIDLCQIYGLHEDTTTALRTHGRNGEILATLASRKIGDEEYPDFIHIDENDVKQGIKTQYADLPCVKEMNRLFPSFAHRFSHFYATGLEQGNSSVGYVAISTLFLREHNRLVKVLREKNPDWDEERLFQTARNINIVILIKLVTEVYIAHLSNNNLIKLDVEFAEREPWYRTNWIAAEFDLLYRWHSLIPDTIKINKKDEEQDIYRCNNALFETVGLVNALSEFSTQSAGSICLKNSPSYLMKAEEAAIQMGRDIRLQSYNAYRENFSLPKIKDFDELMDKSPLQDELKKLYGGDIEKLEFIVGLYAEKPSGGRLYGNLMTAMVGYDAMTHIHTNPLLSKNIYNEDTFTKEGLKIIKDTNSLDDLVKRNLVKPPPPGVLAQFGYTPPGSP